MRMESLDSPDSSFVFIYKICQVNCRTSRSLANEIEATARFPSLAPSPRCLAQQPSHENSAQADLAALRDNIVAKERIKRHIRRTKQSTVLI